MTLVDERLLTEAERGKIARLRAAPCKHGHDRGDSPVYRNGPSLYLQCRRCLRDRVRRFRRSIAQ